MTYNPVFWTASALPIFNMSLRVPMRRDEAIRICRVGSAPLYPPYFYSR